MQKRGQRMENLSPIHHKSSHCLSATHFPGERCLRRGQPCQSFVWGAIEHAFTHNHGEQPRRRHHTGRGNTRCGGTKQQQVELHLLSIWCQKWGKKSARRREALLDAAPRRRCTEPLDGSLSSVCLHRQERRDHQTIITSSLDRISPFLVCFWWSGWLTRRTNYTWDLSSIRVHVNLATVLRNG